MRSSSSESSNVYVLCGMIGIGGGAEDSIVEDSGSIEAMVSTSCSGSAGGDETELDCSMTMGEASIRS